MMLATPVHPSVQVSNSQEATMRRALIALLFSAVSLPTVIHAQSPATSDRSFVVEYYYKTKWGHADEFLKLFKKNHYPILKKETELGRITKVWMDQPRYHTTEDGRWDFRVTIIFKNATAASLSTKPHCRSSYIPTRKHFSERSSGASKS
jgi:hypothetical protein